MRITKFFFLVFSLLIVNFIANAQAKLTVDEAISIVLKNNFDILATKNDADIAKINNTSGNAGMLPTVSITGSNYYSINDNSQKITAGGDVKTGTVNTNSFTAGIALNWTLFDGGKMFVTKNKLNEIQALGEIQYKAQVMQTVYNVIVAYYDVVRQKQQLNSLNEVITFNKERVKILQTSFDAGLSQKTNLLQAKIDLNVFSENFVNQQITIQTSERALNQLLSRDTEIRFEVEDSISENYNPDRQALISKLNESNASILAWQKQVSIAELTLKELNTYKLPKINFSTGFNLLQTDNSSGSFIMNRNTGPQIGASISIPIYQAGNANRQINVAKLQLQSTNYDLDNVKLFILSQLQNALTAFENHQKLLAIEKDNALLTKENLEISMQRLRYGQTTSLEVRQAQESYVDSHTRLINFKYNLKVAETKIKQLMSQL